MRIDTVLHNYEHAADTERNFNVLERNITVLNQAKDLADSVDDWDRSKRCRYAAKAHEEA